MSDQSSRRYGSLLISALVMAGIGWPGLALVVMGTRPTVGPRWLFFFLWTLAATGTALPFVWLLHKRFRSQEPAPASTLLRQGVWVGLYASLLVWLQINRSLDISLALLLGMGLASFEWLLGWLQRSSWRPSP